MLVFSSCTRFFIVLLVLLRMRGVINDLAKHEKIDDDDDDDDDDEKIDAKIKSKLGQGGGIGRRSGLEGRPGWGAPVVPAEKCQS